MDEIKRLTPAQRARCNRLIRRLCANYDGGNCLPLDDGEGCVCVQMISYSQLCKSKPPVQRVVCSRAISPCYRPAPQDAGFHFVQAYCLCLFRHPLKGCLYYSPPLKGSSYSRTLNLSSAISCFSWSSMYFLMVASFRPTVLT